MDAITLNELLRVVSGLIEQGEGHRTLVFTDVDGPELWAVTSEVAENVPGMLFVGDVDETG